MPGGNNSRGQLGNDSTADSPAPVAVTMPNDAVGGQATFKQVSAGQSHSLAVSEDGTAYSWGANDAGQLGNDTSLPHSEPEKVITPNDDMGMPARFTWVGAGDRSSVALAEGGASYGWGINEAGQAGTDDWVDTKIVLKPRKMKDWNGRWLPFEQVSAGWSHSLAVTKDGTAYAWGANKDDQQRSIGSWLHGKPTPVNMTVKVTGVSFGEAAGTDLERSSVYPPDGKWRVTTPPHTSGTVDVVVSWTLNDVPQQVVTHRDAFTYFTPGPPIVTDPADQTVTAGQEP